MKKNEKLLSLLRKNVSLLREVIGVGFFFLLLSIAAFFFLRSGEYVTVKLRITQSDGLKNYLVWDMPPLWYTQILKPGMGEQDFFGRSMIEIKNVLTSFPEDNEELVYVELKIKAIYNKRTKQYSYNGVPLLIGSYHRFKLSGLQIPGVIHSVGDLGSNNFETKKYTLTGFLDPRNNEGSVYNFTNKIVDLVRFDGVPIYISKLLYKGLQMKDDQGKIYAEIIDVKKGAARKYIIDRDKEISIIDPEREKVELTVEINATMINGRPYFKDDVKRMTVGNTLFLDFNDFGVSFTISSLEASLVETKPSS